MVLNAVVHGYRASHTRRVVSGPPLHSRYRQFEDPSATPVFLFHK